MSTFEFIIILTLAYLSGSIPWGYVFGKIAGIDIRTKGSQNIGATNVYRTLGKVWGTLTLIGDVLKGTIPVVLVYYFLPADNWQLCAIALMPILGHTFPVWLKFKGGKAVATSAGVYLPLFPLPLLIALIVFVFVVFIITKRVIALGSLSAVFAFLIAYYGIKWDFNFDLAYSVGLAYTLLATIPTLIIIWRHRANIKRLLRGQEKTLLVHKD